MKTVISILLILMILFLSACAQAPSKVETVFYPAPPETPRVQFLTSISRERDLGEQSQFSTFLLGEDAQGGKQLARPNAIAHEKGKI